MIKTAKLKYNTFYWVRLATYWANTGETELDKDKTIGFYGKPDYGGKAKSGLWAFWQIIGSDETYETYNKDILMSHAETRVIPIKEVNKHDISSKFKT